MSARSDPDALRAAWETAARDLGIQVSTDGWLLDDEGNRHELAVIVRDFGGTRGMAIFEQADQHLNDLAAAQGFGYTSLGRSYETYDRSLFEETLNDWRWTGEGEPPS